MKKLFYLLCSIMLSANMTFADTCFIAKEKDQILKSEGDPDKRYAPMSTFKIPLSLIGFDSGILLDEMHPIWPFKDEIDRCLKNGVYQNQIFFFENLGFIEHTDARKISYEDALIFEQIHLDVYKECGFDIMIVPKGLTVTQRCEFILERVQ